MSTGTMQTGLSKRRFLEISAAWTGFGIFLCAWLFHYYYSSRATIQFSIHDEQGRALLAEARVDGELFRQGDIIGVSKRYAYDFEDRLTAFTNGTIAGTCHYDGVGNRLERTVSGVVRRFALDRLGALTQVLVEADNAGAPVAYYVYGLGLAQRITPAGEASTYHFDPQGSAVALTDSAGSVTYSYAYDSFGVLANSEGGSPQPFRYLARYGIIDDDTGLSYARARFFSAELGRFLTKDPIDGRDGNNQSLNRYAYALNSPLKMADIAGLSPHDVSTDNFNAVSQINLSDIPAEILQELLKRVGSDIQLYVDKSSGGIVVGELRLSPGTSIDLRGLGYTLKFAGRAIQIYGIGQGIRTELGQRAVNFSTLGDSLRHLPENLSFAWNNKLAAWQAVNDSLNSYNAVFVNTFTLNLFEITGDDVQRRWEADVNLFQPK